MKSDGRAVDYRAGIKVVRVRNTLAPYTTLLLRGYISPWQAGRRTRSSDLAITEPADGTKTSTRCNGDSGHCCSSVILLKIGAVLKAPRKGVPAKPENGTKTLTGCDRKSVVTVLASATSSFTKVASYRVRSGESTGLLNDTL